MSSRSLYLVQIFDLAEADGEPVSTGDIARAVDKSPAAATEMIQRLADDGLVDHESYHGVTLTAVGRREAAQLHDRYETLQRFFSGVLDLEDANHEAALLSGTVSPTVISRLEETLLPPRSAADPQSVETEKQQ
jgi:DtxR family Mn-dependent transcriptional regulator